MITKGRKKGSVRFSLQPTKGAAKVFLVGSFNEWQPQAMRKGKDGSFSATVDLPAGVYEYKFVVDGQWSVDPDHSDWSANPFGTMNSVVRVE
ncbi:MAG TPA: isoamylase early set domain-containing protein [Phycisphaerae bacterium]|nr:isoamylase early set domain-containing protein [Phycisphaerae bacterium]